MKLDNLFSVRSLRSPFFRHRKHCSVKFHKFFLSHDEANPGGTSAFSMRLFFVLRPQLGHSTIFVSSGELFVTITASAYWLLAVLYPQDCNASMEVVDVETSCL